MYKKLVFTIGLAVSALALSAQDIVKVGGEAMYPTKNIVQNAVNSKDHTTLVAAVKAAGLVQDLSRYLLQPMLLSTNYLMELLQHY
jgi:uncharacterized surface protein with fasciclin (FAS1) repeats